MQAGFRGGLSLFLFSFYEHDVYKAAQLYMFFHLNHKAYDYLCAYSVIHICLNEYLFVTSISSSD